MIPLFSLIIIVFSLFAVSRAFLRFRSKQITSRELSFWIVLWGVIIAAALWPTSFALNQILGIRRPIDVFVYTSIVVLFYLLFRMYVAIDDTQKEITKLIQQLALKKKK